MKTFRKFFAIALLALAAACAFSQSKKPWEVEEDEGLRKAFNIGNNAFFNNELFVDTIGWSYDLPDTVYGQTFAWEDDGKTSRIVVVLNANHREKMRETYMFTTSVILHEMCHVSSAIHHPYEHHHAKCDQHDVKAFRDEVACIEGMGAPVYHCW